MSRARAGAGRSDGAGWRVYFYCWARLGGMELLPPSPGVTETQVWLRRGMQFGRSSAEVEVILENSRGNSGNVYSCWNWEEDF